MRLRDYIEVARLAQEIVEDQGTSYQEAIKKAKEKLLSDRVGAHKSENSITNRINHSITENIEIKK